MCISLQTTNRKWYKVYWLAPFPMTLNVLRWNLRAASLSKYDFSDSFETVANISIDKVLRGLSRPSVQEENLWDFYMPEVPSVT